MDQETKLTPYWLRLITLTFAVISVGMSVLCFSRLHKLNKAADAKPVVMQYDKDSGLAEYQLEKQIREIVREEYATYQADLQNILAVAGIVFTLFSIGVPLMNYVFLQREHVQDLRNMMTEASEHLEEQKKLAEESEEQLDVQRKGYDALTEMLGEAEDKISEIAEKHKNQQNQIEKQLRKTEMRIIEVDEKYGKSIVSLHDRINSVRTLGTPQGEPTIGQSYVISGNAALSKGKYEEAIEFYMHAASAYEANQDTVNNALIYSNLATAYAWQKNYDRSLEYSDMAIQLDDKKAIHYHVRADTLHKKGDYDKAIFDRDKAIELDPSNALYYEQRSTTLLKMSNRPPQLYKKREFYEAALRDSNKAIELDESNNARYFYQRSVVLHAMKRYDDALESCSQAIRVDIQKEEYYFFRTIIYRSLAISTDNPSKKTEYDLLAREDEATAKKLREDETNS